MTKIARYHYWRIDGHVYCGTHAAQAQSAAKTKTYLGSGIPTPCAICGETALDLADLLRERDEARHTVTNCLEAIKNLKEDRRLLTIERNELAKCLERLLPVAEADDHTARDWIERGDGMLLRARALLARLGEL